MPQLIIKWGNRETRFAVTTQSVDIGRSDDNILQIKDAKVSRYQCKIVQTPLGFLLSDSESSNGTFLNGKRVERTLLHNNDVLKIGNVEIVFSESDSVQSENKGPVIISSGLSSADASVGEETTVINIQDEIESSSGNGEKLSQNGTAQVAVFPPRRETAVIAQVAKRIGTAGKPQNGVVATANGVGYGELSRVAAAKPVVAQRVMNNHILQNGSGKPSGTPASQTQPARIVAAKPVPISPPAPKPAPAVSKPALRIPPPPAPKPPVPAARITPAPKPLAPASKITPAPKPQSGLISRLAKTPKPPRNNRNSAVAVPASSVSRIPAAGIKDIKAGKPDRSGRKEDAMQGPAQPKKNKNMLYIIGGAVLMLIVIIIFVASSGSNKKADEDTKREIEVLNAVNKLYDEKDYKGALEKYEAFLDEFKNSKNADAVKERISKIKERDEKEKESKPKLAELKRKKKDYSTSKYPELLKEFDDFIKEYSDVSPVIIQEAKGERETIKRIVSSSGENEVNVLFNKALGEANTLRDKKDYDGAIAKLKSFLKENRSLNDRQENAIKNEIKAMEKEKGEKSEKK